MTMPARWQPRWIDERGIEQGAPWSTREEPLAAYCVRQEGSSVSGRRCSGMPHSSQQELGTGAGTSFFIRYAVR